MAGRVRTIGHSTHDAEGFFSLLDRHAIRALADVRAHPGSRRHPHFAREALASACAERAIHRLPGFARIADGSPVYDRGITGSLDLA